MNPLDKWERDTAESLRKQIEREMKRLSATMYGYNFTNVEERIAEKPYIYETSKSNEGVEALKDWLNG